MNENETYDFLRDIVAKVPDPVANDEKPKRRRNTTSAPSNQEDAVAVAEGSSALDADAEPAKVAPARRPRRAAFKPSPVEAQDDDEEDEAPPPRKRGRQARTKAPKDEEPSEPAAAAASVPAMPEAAAVPANLDDDEDYDADE